MDVVGANKPCFNSTLAQISSGCLQRKSLVQTFSAQPLLSMQLPIYLLTVPWLPHRMKLMEARLMALGSPDVTVVWCANKEDVEALSNESMECLHPRYVITSFSRNPSGAFFNAARDYRSNKLRLFNGTLSLALKHRIAYRDMLQRWLRSALILEDDATVSPDLWTTLSAYQVPLIKS